VPARALIAMLQSGRGLTPLSLARMAQLALDAGLPSGVMHVVLGMPGELLGRIAKHAERDPSTEINARRATRADYEKLLRSPGLLTRGSP
jgi:hypothetical protein